MGSDFKDFPTSLLMPETYKEKVKGPLVLQMGISVQINYGIKMFQICVFMNSMILK